MLAGSVSPVPPGPRLSLALQTGGDHQKPADFRVLHNIALTTFALGGCTSANQLLREISTLDRYLR